MQSVRKKLYKNDKVGKKINIFAKQKTKQTNEIVKNLAKKDKQMKM